MIETITFNDGQTLDIDPALKMSTLREMQNEGILPDGFIDSMMGVALSGSVDDFVSATMNKIKFDHGGNYIFAAYRNAGGDMTFAEFLSRYPVDAFLYVDVYRMILTACLARPSDVAKAYSDATPRQKSKTNSKKKYHE